jgi:GNAT superfamily N-acetyltransferase
MCESNIRGTASWYVRLMLPADLEISTDPSRLDLDLVHAFLTTSYWAEGRPRAVVERSIANSICFGGYTSGRQVAFGRAVTDRAVYAYFADIFVVPEYRGRGVGKRLVQAMVEHPDIAAVNGIQLRTRDAHGLYAQFGFGSVSNASELMARYRG